MIVICGHVLTKASIHARKAEPREACGVFYINRMTRSVEYMPFTNSAEEPESGFEIEASTMADLYVNDHEVLALFHSHPKGRREPSTTDVESFPEHITKTGIIYAQNQDPAAFSWWVTYNADGTLDVIAGDDALLRGIAVEGGEL